MTEHKKAHHGVRGRLGRHIRSNLVGYLALVVALTMTPLPSHAGHLVVRTSDIVKGAVTTGKLGKGAVTTAKLGKKSVTTPKIKNDAVGFRHLNVTEAVGTTDMPNGAVDIAFAPCPGDSVPISGGAVGLNTAGDPVEGWVLGASIPRDDGAGWWATAKNGSGSPGTLRVTALCLRP